MIKVQNKVTITDRDPRIRNTSISRHKSRMFTKKSGLSGYRSAPAGCSAVHGTGCRLPQASTRSSTRKWTNSFVPIRSTTRRARSRIRPEFSGSESGSTSPCNGTHHPESKRACGKRSSSATRVVHRMHSCRRCSSGTHSPPPDIPLMGSDTTT